MRVLSIIVAYLVVVGCSERVFTTHVSDAASLEAAVKRKLPMGVSVDSAERTLTRDGFACVRSEGVPLAMQCRREDVVTLSGKLRQSIVEFGFDDDAHLAKVDVTVREVRK